jgi:hypothetical protein
VTEKPGGWASSSLLPDRLLDGAGCEVEFGSNRPDAPACLTKMVGVRTASMAHREHTSCMCLQHGDSMVQGDHTACIVELLACPEHRDEQLLQIGKVDTSDLISVETGPTLSIGFCLSCGRDFNTLDEVRMHSGQNTEARQVFRQFTDEESNRNQASSKEE